MDRRQFLKTAAVGSVWTVWPSAALRRSPRKRPHVVFVLVDDLGWADLGCYGSRFHETPHLDALAASGMRFTQAYAASPVCSPTRASIMTGKYPTRVGITDWIPGKDPGDRMLQGPDDLHALPLEETSLAEAFRAAGYKTFFAGKWHLGGQGHFPEDQGFQINKGGHDKGSPPGGYTSPYKNPKLKDGEDGEYLTDRLTDECIRFLESEREHPLFLYLAFYTVHTPIQGCKRHLRRFEEKLQRAKENPVTEKPGAGEADGFRKERNGWTKLKQDDPKYASMVYAMDENVGRLLDKIDELGMTDDTIVVLTSDNGGLSTLGRQWAPTSNEPLRAGKGWCYEGGIREPLLVRVPNMTRPGSLCHAPVISPDFYPTLLELAGLPLRPQQHRDGLSLVPLLEGKDRLEREALFWHYPHYHGSTWTPGAAVRAGEWKLIHFFEEERVELYRLSKDPSERTNLASQFPEKRDSLLRLLGEWQRDTGAKMPWRPLFNGKDLEGWDAFGNAVWRVEDGVLVGGQEGDASRSGLLVTRALFQDFELELDFMIDEHGKYNSGVYLRNEPGKACRTGYQVNIGRAEAGEYCGLFLHDWLSKGDERDEVRRRLDWNHYRIIAQGAHIVVFLNQVKIVDYEDPDAKDYLLQPGVIGLQTYGAEGHAGWVKFRRVRIREIPPLVPVTCSTR